MKVYKYMKNKWGEKKLKKLEKEAIRLREEISRFKKKKKKKNGILRKSKRKINLIRAITKIK